MTGIAVSRIGDFGDHTNDGKSATLITGSYQHSVDNIPLVRIGDLVLCPISQHGVNPIISVNYGYSSGGQGLDVCHISAVSSCQCTIITGSYTTFRG